MSEKFKKGQIIPKRLRLAITSEAKAQHCVTFGADVEVTGKQIKLLSDGSAIYIPRVFGRPRKNGTRQKVELHIVGVSVIAAEFDGKGIQFNAN